MRRPFPRRCEDLTRDPAASGAEIDRADLAEHLASCPSCASRAEADAPLIRLWDATRPAEPTDAAWETVWGRLSERLDRPERPALVLVMSPWRRHAMTAFFVAQAAAVLAAVAVWGFRRPTDVAGPGLETVVKARAAVDIEPGQIVMIHLDSNEFRAVDPVHETQRWDALDENLVLFNDAEALAGMQETIAEMRHDVHSAPPPG